MIVKSGELSKIPDEKINFYLLYGINTGFIEEVIEKTFISNFSKNIFNYNEKEILLDRSNFEENILNFSLFDNDKLIIVNRATDKIFDIIEKLSETKIDNCKIVLKSSILEKKSKLRNYFEKSKNKIIIPFYEDNYQSLFSIVQKYLKKNNIKLSTEIINLVIEKTKGDRIFLKKELEKIYSFSLNKKNISFPEIKKLTNVTLNSDINELADTCLLKDLKKTQKILNEMILSNEDNIKLLKTFLLKLKKLKVISKKFNEVKNLENAISSIKPPIFWKEKDMVIRQFKKLSLNDISLLIKEINNLEYKIKKNSNISDLLLQDYIFKAAS